MTSVSGRTGGLDRAGQACRFGLVGLVALAAGGGVSGCAPLVVGGALAGAGVAGYTVLQEREVGEAFNDTEIKLQLTNSLLQHEEPIFSKVETEVIEGRVLLAGVVDSPEHRIDAARIAWNVNGVQEVINEIEVGDPTNFGDFGGDTVIAGQVRAALLRAPDIQSYNFTIETVRGTVYVLGIAQSYEEIVRVTQIVYSVSGVNNVINHAIVKTDQRRLQAQAQTQTF